jgi:hypothetical protein
VSGTKCHLCLRPLTAQLVTDLTGSAPVGFVASSVLVPSFSLSVSIGSYLRLAHALHVNVHRQAHVAVPQNRSTGFVVDTERVKVRRTAAAEGVPPILAGKEIVALVDMRFRLVLILLLSADGATRQRRHDRAAREVIEIEGFPISGLEDRSNRELTHAEFVSFERVSQSLHDGNWRASVAFSEPGKM